MNRRPPPGRRREIPGGEGPFDRLFGSRFERDPAPLIIGGTIIFLAILLLILFLPPVSLLGGGGDEGPGEVTDVGCGITARRIADVPDLPEGLVALSPFYELTVPAEAEEQGCRLTSISLDTPTQDPSNLAFYTYRDGTWMRLAAATLVNDGTAAEAELEDIPDNLTVLRLAAATYVALGSLPSGTSVDPAAAGLLSIVSPVDYAPTADGSIVGTATSLADQGFDIYPTIAAREGDAVTAVNTILRDSSLTTRHIEDIVSLAGSGDFRGIDIDYRKVDASLRSQFSQFVADLAQELHKTGRKLSIALPLPSGRDGNIDTGAYDWERLGTAADYVKILPESDQSLYRNRMVQVLRYATRIIEPGKVFLVVSPFSQEKSREGVRALTFLEAMGIANVMTVVPGAEDSANIVGGHQVIITGDNIHRGTGGSGIKWSDETATVTFSYRVDDETRTVWVENVFSAGFKLELVQAFRLGGVAIEDVSEGSGGANIWAAVDSLVRGGLAQLARPHPDNLRPEWTASGGTIEAPGTGGAATWIPPDEGGTYEISLIVSDGISRVGRRLTLEVQGTVTPTPTPEEEVTPPPEETVPPGETETPPPEETETPPPEETETPEATPTPEETETPEATPTPEETETPEATPTPEETETATPEGETSAATP
ncbi:MAG: glycosyl hydrolase family 18 protein [Dehalococcoidia bacterium]